MKKFTVIAAAAAVLFSAVSCSEPESYVPEKPLSIVPVPVSVEYAGKGLEIKDINKAKIRTSVDRSLAEEEYVLDTRSGRAVIKGGSEAGIYWGAQTLRQIVAQTEGKVPGVLIKDRPAFAYRGLHLDCCRHFFSVDEVKEYIDIIALHKLNVLHWHLTDDQGWRAEIKAYPKLTEVGSQRAETLVGHYGSDEYDGTPYGGFYTQEEMRDVVKYAEARHVTVIPEIEMPGHASAALASYPELGCEGKDYKVQTTWGIFPEVFCIGKEATYDLLEGVLDEICGIFPSEYIHIGGDEAPRTAWCSCEDCQRLLSEQGLENEAQLQSYLVNRIEKYLADKGRKIIGWDEILEGGVSQSATVMSWRGPKGGIAAAKLGNDVVMTPNNYYYLDYYQTADPKGNDEPMAIGGYVSLRKAYAFDPYDQLDDEQKSHIKGIQANMWTEYVATFDHIEHMVLPRAAALAEVAWSGENRTSYEEFVARVETVLVPEYEARGYNYADYAFKGIE